MKRRALLLGLLVLSSGAGMANAQPGKKARVGLLTPGVGLSPRHEVFRDALRTHGWVEGQNLTIEYRFGGDDYERLRALADDLVQLKVDVIYAATAPSAQAAKIATRDIPIVFHTLNDPVRAGLVASFSRPGGNLTGNAGLGPELDRKRIELLKEIVPSLAVVTVLINPSNVMTAPRLGVVEDAARALKLQTRAIEASDKKSLDRALQTMARNKPAGLIEEGGLIEYAPNQNQLIKQAAAYVDRILRGARPFELPIEQAEKFDVVINLKTAKALGISMPMTVLHRADHVIE